jgi:hypothetical protein
LGFPESPVETICEFGKVAVEMLAADTVVDTPNVAFCVAYQDVNPMEVAEYGCVVSYLYPSPVKSFQLLRSPPRAKRTKRPLRGDLSDFRFLGITVKWIPAGWYEARDRAIALISSQLGKDQLYCHKGVAFLLEMYAENASLEARRQETKLLKDGMDAGTAQREYKTKLIDAKEKET